MAELISLIVCTIGRREPFARLLTSLEAQVNGVFELIVVDQSDTGAIEECVRRFRGGRRVCHLRSEKGLSRARNLGLRHAEGTIVGFPDDDCWYSEQVTEYVRRFFQGSESAVLTGRTVDRSGTESVSVHRRESGLVERTNVFASGNSNTLFVRTAVARDVGGFDETLGVGAATPFQSGEETDFMLRCLRKGYRLSYDRDFIVYHDQTEGSAEMRAARVRAYSQGYGRVLRLHGYGFGYLSARIGRAVLRGALCLASGDSQAARRRYDWIDGSLRGFLARIPENEPPVAGKIHLSKV